MSAATRGVSFKKTMGIVFTIMMIIIISQLMSPWLDWLFFNALIPCVIVFMPGIYYLVNRNFYAMLWDFLLFVYLPLLAFVSVIVAYSILYIFG